MAGDGKREIIGLGGREGMLAFFARVEQEGRGDDFSFYTHPTFTCSIANPKVGGVGSQKPLTNDLVRPKSVMICQHRTWFLTDTLESGNLFPGDFIIKCDQKETVTVMSNSCSISMQCSGN